MSTYSFKLFGSYLIQDGAGNTVHFRTDKERALLAYLLVEADQAHHREQLMDLLWPGLPERSARSALRQVLSLLRKDIPPAEATSETISLLQTDRQMVQINVAFPYSADVAYFRQALASAQAQRSHDWLLDEAYKESLEQAVACYNGPFLLDYTVDDSNTFEEWAQIQRESFRHQLLDGLHQLATINLHRGNYADAEAFARRQIEIDNLSEIAYQQLMEILARAGQAAQAVIVYEKLSRLLRAELGMAPGSRTTALFERIRSGDLDADEAGQLKVRGYELRDRQGEGAFGAVYLATQRAVNRTVAIKVVKPEHASKPDFIRRFESEAQIIARLEHPHIVPLYDYWREPAGAFLVMRWLDGGTLETRLSGDPLPIAQTLATMEQITAALYYAHEQGVVHRDIKPANILLDNNGNAYLSDFGIAKDLLRDLDLTHGEAMIGSPAYISPEQVLNEPVTPRTDIYTLGVVLFELLTGEKPFRGASLATIIYKHVNESLPLAHALRPELPATIDDIIQRATAKRPEERFANVRELANALKTLFGHQENSYQDTLLAAQPELLGINPYRGLHAFQEADAALFFGRNRLVEKILDRWRQNSFAQSLPTQRFLAIVGPSGSGKSSVAKAGVIPALRSSAVPGSADWYVTDMVPGSHPFEELEIALRRVASDAPADLLTPLYKDKRGLVRVLRHVLPAGPGGRSGQLLLVIDQFEELFTLVDDEPHRRAFIDSLLAALMDTRSQLRLLVTLRADFYDRPLQYGPLGELIREQTELVLPLTPTELEEAVRAPAGQAGVRLEPGLVAAITADVNDQPGALPLLQYALTELFERRQTDTMTLAAYQEIGGVLGALGQRAETLFQTVDESKQEMARQLFLRLITLGEGSEDTRRRALLREIEEVMPHASEATGQDLAELIELYGRHRLLTFDHDPVTRGATVEVAHEALIREWPRLRGWLQDSRDDVRRQRRLAQATVEWERNDQEESFLWRGANLDQFAGWAETTTVALTPGEQIFMAESLAARNRRQAAEEARRQRELAQAQQLAEEQSQRAEEQGRAARRLRVFASGLALVLMAAIFAAWLAFKNNQEAQANLLESERSRLALQAQSVFDRGEGAELTTLLALRSLALGYSVEAEQALQAALRQGFPRQQFLGHTDDVQSVTFTPDGMYIYSTSSDATVRLWNAQTGQELQRFIGHQSATLYADISPDGKYLASSGADQTVRVWEIASGSEILRFPGIALGSGLDFSADGSQLLIGALDKLAIYAIPSGSVLQEFFYGPQGEFNATGAQFSPDGHFIVSLNSEGKIYLWSVATGEQIREFTGHTGWVGEVTFSPDGQYVLTTGQDGTARLWDIHTGNELRRFVGHDNAIFTGHFSPDGQLIVTGSYDRTARVWDIASGQTIKIFRGHTDFVNVGFSQDSRRVVTGSGDETIKLWDLYEESEPVQVADFTFGHLQSQTAATMSPDGRYVVLGRLSGELRILDTLPGGSLVEIDDVRSAVTAVALTPDNSTLAAGDASGQISLFRRQTGEMIHQQSYHQEGITALQFAADGSLLISASQDGTSRVIDTLTGAVRFSLAGHDGAIQAIVVTENRPQLVTGGQDGLVKLWDLVTGREVRTIREFDSAVHSLTFSPDGQRIGVGTAAANIQIIELEDGIVTQQLIGHTGPITHLLFSADSQHLISASLDLTVRLWNLADGSEIHQYVGHISPPLYLALAQHGEHVITADGNGAYRWHFDLDALIQYACSRLPRDFSAAERQIYQIDDQPTCAQWPDGNQIVRSEPAWTPLPPGLDRTIPTILETQLDFVHLEVANTGMGFPVQHVLFAEGANSVVRAPMIGTELLSLPLFTAAIPLSDTLEPPYDLGPFPMGQPLGFTMADWLAAEGHGTYIIRDGKAAIDVTFENLVPHGVYTLWCVDIRLLPTFEILQELPCGALDGSENNVFVDGNGQATIQVNIPPFPVSTDELIYEIALAYHSDGQTYGTWPGDYAHNLHIQLIYDFLPPGQQ